MNLLEAYKKRLSISESIYGRSHNGEKMDNHRKLLVAKVLQNTNAFLTEAFDTASATQRSDMGMFKKFCLNLTTVALPNLIANDLVIVHPMSSMSGYITYLNYSAGKTKGDIEQGDLFNNPFQLGDYKSGNYTANAVSEVVADASAAYQPMWIPVLTGTFHTIVVNGTEVEFDPRANYTAEQLATQATKDVKINTAGVITFANLVDGKVPAASLTANCTVAYKYDNIVIPQNDLPTLKAEMKSIPLIARARRIAVYYSQIAAFQAKTDYGFDLGDSLAEQAVGQLSYEIDTEVVNLLNETAITNTTPEEATALTWSRTLPIGVSKQEHYAGFTEVVERAREFIYNKTKKFAPNYMIISSSILPILTFIPGFNAAPAGQINGPYFCGTLNSLRVYVSPAMAYDTFCIGCNGSDMMSSVNLVAA